MDKDILNKTVVAKDIKDNAIQIIINSIVFIVFIISATVFLIYIFRAIPSYYFLSLFPFLGFAISAFNSLIKYLWILYRVIKGKFYITTSKLTTSYRRQGWSSSSLTGTLLFRKPCRLLFTSYGEYLVPEGKNYKWSKKHCMDANSVCDYAINGDEYYIAVINNKIYSAYNKKLFELEK